MQNVNPVPESVGRGLAQPQPSAPTVFDVRWQFIESGQLKELSLAQVDELQVSVLDTEFKPKGVLLADYFGDAMEWSKFEFEFESSKVDLNSISVNAGPWPHGISVNTVKCKELGRKERFVNVLENGSDLLLSSLPEYNTLCLSLIHI